MPKTSQAQLKAQRKYDQKATVQIHLKMNRVTDADVLQKLESVPNKQGYIKDLIRKDIEQGKK